MCSIARIRKAAWNSSNKPRADRRAGCEVPGGRIRETAQQSPRQSAGSRHATPAESACGTSAGSQVADRRRQRSPAVRHGDGHHVVDGETLGQYNQPEVIEALLGWLKDGTAGEQVEEPVFEIIQTLGRLDHPATQQALIALLTAEDPRVVILAIDSLGQQSSEVAWEPIERQVGRRDYQSSYAFRFSVLNAVSQFHDPRDGRARRTASHAHRATEVPHCRSPDAYHGPAIRCRCATMGPVVSDASSARAAAAPGTVPRQRLRLGLPAAVLL